MNGWNYPPGVSGNEWQITGECPGCGATADEECQCEVEDEGEDETPT